VQKRESARIATKPTRQTRLIGATAKEQDDKQEQEQEQMYHKNGTNINDNLNKKNNDQTKGERRV
jgi:hypothetical protein